MLQHVIYIYVHVCACQCVQAHMCACLCACVHVSLHAFLHARMRMQVCICVHSCACMCACPHVCMCIHVQACVAKGGGKEGTSFYNSGMRHCCWRRGEGGCQGFAVRCREGVQWGLLTGFPLASSVTLGKLLPLSAPQTFSSVKQA